MNIVFFDDVAPSAYDGHTLSQRGMGGSEATLVRVAQGMAQIWAAQVWVVQAKREDHATITVNQVTYLSPHAWAHAKIQPQLCIYQRDGARIETCHAAYPHASHVFWLHNMFDRVFARVVPILQRHNVWALGVSRYHQTRMRTVAIQAGFANFAQSHIHFAYNPIDAAVYDIPSAPSYDPFLLSYTSSPERGLAQTVAIFEQLRQRDARYQLHIYNPGYNHIGVALPTGAQWCGSLSCVALNRTIQNSLCVLQANRDIPEMFGLVYAEANQVGVPVLAHPMGAAPEVLNETIAQQRQLIDMHDCEAVIARIMAWSHGARPVVSGQHAFGLPQVIQQWHFFTQPFSIEMS